MKRVKRTSTINGVPVISDFMLGDIVCEPNTLKPEARGRVVHAGGVFVEVEWLDESIKKLVVLGGW
ncbi:hypothetical protein PP175_28975 (plasmid) [Aneurinibacillus sp. Ricciae_BoGa-3]|uniref:hypothetical protein n=1 Tax=Aneurinibacillus sp. Ricciae_BoGa-3 TaxID=3022697 RepID=UPI002341D2C5|nr:hypothetical protein [Aneurinibacillus sp. Ricciae_BoGa-3]WCK57225.1 hypothetical protein PP175_28975 [Aneurinibacillus sp. Ricciae_BoGa-3]